MESGFKPDVYVNKSAKSQNFSMNQHKAYKRQEWQIPTTDKDAIAKSVESIQKLRREYKSWQ